jgi:hypothetical protein
MADEKTETPPDLEPPDSEEEEWEDDEDQSTPFDHPFFLPVLLIGFALWFGYDGWFNEDMEWLKFNRYGFGVLAVAAAYYSWRAVKEQRGWICPACSSQNGRLDRQCTQCNAAPPTQPA